MRRSFLQRLNRAVYGKLPQGVRRPVVASDPFPITSSGLSAAMGSAGTWTHIWDFEETTGNPVDELAAATLTKNAGNASYVQVGPTHEKNSISVGSTCGFNYDLGAIGTSDYALLFTMYLNNATGSRAVANVSVYGGGTGWKYPTMGWIPSANLLQWLTYNLAGTGNETTLEQSSFTAGTWHDILVVYKNGTGMRLFSNFGTMDTDTTPFVGNWPNYDGACQLNFGANSTWGVNAPADTKYAYAAFTLDETAVADLYTNGDTRLAAFRALRTVTWPTTPILLAASLGYGSTAWRSLVLFGEPSGGVDDHAVRHLTPTGVSGDDTITYRREGPEPTKYSVAVRDTGAGANTGARLAYATNTLHPAGDSFAALCVFKCTATDTTTRTLFGIETGGAYWRVRCSGTAGILSFQVYDGTLSNAVVGVVDHHDQWVACLVIFDQSTDTLYLTTNLGENVSATGVSIGNIENASASMTIGSSDCHKTVDFAYFAFTTTITDLVANRVTVLTNFVADVGM